MENVLFSFHFLVYKTETKSTVAYMDEKQIA